MELIRGSFWRYFQSKLRKNRSTTVVFTVGRWKSTAGRSSKNRPRPTDFDRPRTLVQSRPYDFPDLLQINSVNYVFLLCFQFLRCGWIIKAWLLKKSKVFLYTLFIKFICRTKFTSKSPFNHNTHKCIACFLILTPWILKLIKSSPYYLFRIHK